MSKVHILPQNQTVEVPAGSNLLAVLREQGVAPEAPCGGFGTCGKCKVMVDGKEVLSCQTTVSGDITVTLPEKVAKTNIMVDGLDVDCAMNPEKEGYLLAYDIGTTTVVCFLLDGITGQTLGSASMLNPQAPFGADVISRIQAALSGELQRETEVIRQGMTTLCLEMCNEAGIQPKDIGVLCVVANPAMQQLFMGIDPSNLGAVPFAPVITEAKVVPAKDYLPILEQADLLVVPDISGYVGADTMGCVLSTRMYESTDRILMVDIGTNGEMVLGNKERMTACSTAAGPALEGAKIKFGMRGAPGAIDHVWVEDGALKCHVIGDEEARGICGSGLIDAIAAALTLKWINKRGRILQEEEKDGTRFIPLTESVYLTQEDIREVMLAKGAIAAGIELMAEHLGFAVEDIDTVLLAGAFGSFMDPDSACRIGLLPRALKGKITPVGNAAGTGSKLMACNKDEFALSQKLKDKIEFLELANLDNFMHCFAKNMNFKEE